MEKNNKYKLNMGSDNEYNKKNTNYYEVQNVKSIQCNKKDHEEKKENIKKTCLINTDKTNINVEDVSFINVYKVSEKKNVNEINITNEDDVMFDDDEFHNCDISKFNDITSISCNK